MAGSAPTAGSDSGNLSLKRMSEQGNPYTFLALGDSYTAGEGVLPHERWCDQLAGLLRKDGVNITSPVVIAETGWTTTDLLANLDREPAKTKYSLVSMLIGVNNQYRGLPLDVFRKEFQELLNWSAAVSEKGLGGIIVLSIPDWSVTPFAQTEGRRGAGEEIDIYNRQLVEICNRNKVRVVDITSLSRLAGEDGSFLAEDRLHYSPVMYQKWAESALPMARGVIGGNP